MESFIDGTEIYFSVSFAADHKIDYRFWSSQRGPSGSSNTEAATRIVLKATHAKRSIGPHLLFRRRDFHGV